MTLKEICDTCWRGGSARVKTKDGCYSGKILFDGSFSLDSAVPLKILTGNMWELAYTHQYYIEDVITALSKLNPKITDLRRSEWNEWCWGEAEQTVRAIARSLGLIIGDLKRY